MIECSIRLTDDQAQALAVIQEGKRHTLLYGGSRSGKTFLIVYVIVLRALLYAGSRHLIYRLHLTDVVSSIWLETLPKVIKKFSGLSPKLRFNETRHILFFPNDSEIWVSGVDDTRNADAVLGKEYATIYANEASQIPYLTNWKVRTRLAQKIAGCQAREFADLNPTTKAHWTFKESIKLEDPVRSKPGTRVPIDNPESYAHYQLNPDGNKANIDAEYIQSLARAPESMRRRFYLGEYADDDGLLVYPFPPDGFYAGSDFSEWVAKVGPGNVRFVGGLDIGFEDADGFVIIAYCAKPRVTPVAGIRKDLSDRYASQQGIAGVPSNLANEMKKRYLIYEYKMRRSGSAELASAIGSGLASIEKLALSLGCSWACYVYGDTGAGGKKIIADMRDIHHLPIRPAYKRDKLAAIELMQDEVKGGTFLVPAEGAAAQEAEAIVWTKDPDTGEIIREIDDSAYHPDIWDAILYAMRSIWVGGIL
jgi:hypothetical protein